MVELLLGLVCLSLGTELLDPVLHCDCTEKDGTHAAKGQRYNQAVHYAALLTTRPLQRQDPRYVIDTERVTSSDILVLFLERAGATGSHDTSSLAARSLVARQSLFLNSRAWVCFSVPCLLLLRGAVILEELLSKTWTEISLR